MSVRRWTRSSVTPRHTQSGSDHPALVTATAAPAQHAVAGASLMRKLHLTHAAYAAMVGAALLGMIALTVAVARDAGPLPGDVGLTVWWQRLILPHPWLSRLLEIDSTVNWPRPAGILVATAIAVFVALSRWLDAALALATVATADATNFLINQIIQRPRPLGYGVYVDRYISGVYSFPSGHVEHAVACFGSVLLLTFQVRRTGTRTLAVLWVVRAGLILGIVLMGPSRVLMGEHWPSDSLAGLFWGGFWLLISIQVYGWIARRWPRLLGVGEPHPGQRAVA
jgi:membrane-associated phospholipid phosphatase